MADRRDILYRPDIRKPERKREPMPEEIRRGIEDTYMDSQRVSEDLGIPIEDVPVDAYDAMAERFKELELKGKELKSRAIFLLDRTIDDLDGYIGDAPPQILKYIEEMTGRSFTEVVDGKRVMKPKTDSAYTLSPCELKCIFRGAGLYDPGKDEYDVSKAVVDGNSQQVLATVDQLQNSSYMDMLFYGAKLLILVLKMSFVITVHHTVGFACGWLKENPIIRTGLDIFSAFFGLPGIGSIIMKGAEAAEKNLLKVVGFRCNQNNEPPPICDVHSWQEVDIKRVNCCTTKPIFFEEGPTGQMEFDMSTCFERWAREELDPTGAGARTPCSVNNCSDDTVNFTAEEKSKAGEVARYLQERPSRHGVMNPSDINPLSNAIYYSEAGVMMSQQSQSALDSTKSYLHTGERNAPWDCFGYAMEPRDRKQEIFDNVNNAAASYKDTDKRDLIVMKSVFFFDYLKQVDDAITSALEIADKAVIGVANLAKWGASRQLCCYVYLIVLVASLLHSLITKGTICTGMDIGEAVREEMHVRWAAEARKTGELKTLVQLLTLIKQVIDVFRNRMNRAIFLAGLKFPIRAMWELIKTVLANGIAQYLDIIFGPLDQVLAGIKGVPEVRHMVANECFGIDKLFDFLQCLLGNLKWGIVNWIMQFLDFTMNDFTLIDDIYLCRTKMAFLDGISKLLGSMINLILGLRDCYDPSNLTNEIVKREMHDQYNRLENYYEVMNTKGYVVRADECSKSVMNQTFIPAPERQAEIEALDGGLVRSLTEVGFTEFPEEVVKNTLAPDGTTIDLAAFMEITGEEDLAMPVSFGEFIAAMEKQTGVKTAEIEESLRYIFDILKGQETSNNV